MLTVVAFLMIGATTVAGAQTGYPPGVLGLTLAPTSGLPGSTINVSGSGCAAGATVTISFDNGAIGTTVAGPTGAFSTSVTVPTAATPGAHTIVASGAGCNLPATFTVLGTTVGRAGIAFSGAHNVLGLSEAGAGLALLGAVLVFATRRRRELNRHTS